MRAKKVNDLEKEIRLITLCYKRTIAFSEEKQLPISDLCQFIETPRAICLPNGLPYKGAKSVMYDHFEKRYTSKYQVTSNSINFSDSNVCVIIEGMNIIYSSPLKQFKTFQDYAKFLAQRWIYSHYRKGYREVCILFDEHDTQGISPKGIERSRRDSGEDNDNSDAYDSISDNVLLPSNWMNFFLLERISICFVDTSHKTLLIMCTNISRTLPKYLLLLGDFMLGKVYTMMIGQVL